MLAENCVGSRLRGACNGDAGHVTVKTVALVPIAMLDQLAFSTCSLKGYVQMIDTSIVRVHQHGACITRNRKQSMGRSRG
jgi:hypothetical protein